MRICKYKKHGSSEFQNGWFHQWGLDAIDERDGCMTWTIAIVENPDGTVEKVATEDIVLGLTKDEWFNQVHEIVMSENACLAVPQGAWDKAYRQGLEPVDAAKKILEDASK